MPRRTRLAAPIVLSIAALAAAGQSTTPATTPSSARPTLPNPPLKPIQGKLATSIQLFNGKDLVGWSWHSNTATSKIEDVWTIKDGILHCAAKPTGYIRTDKDYTDFVLTVEQRHLTASNGGLYICIHGDDKVWPDAVQIQDNFGKVGDLINQNSAMKKIFTDPARTALVNRDTIATRLTGVEKPLGQWNTLVVTMEKGNLSVTLNGTLVNTASEIDPPAGKVGLQAEGAEMEFRKLELTPIQ